MERECYDGEVQPYWKTDYKLMIYKVYFSRNTEINNGQDYHLDRQQVNFLYHFKYISYSQLITLVAYYMWVTGDEYLCYITHSLNQLTLM